MHNYLKVILFSTAGIMFLGVATYTLAESESGQERARQLRESKNILPLEQILEQAKAQHPGRLIEAELDQEEKRWIYEVEILDENGVVWEMEYDATTGKLLETNQEKQKEKKMIQ